MYALIDPAPATVRGVPVAGRVLVVAPLPRRTSRPRFWVRAPEDVTIDWWWTGTDVQPPTAAMTNQAQVPVIRAEAERRMSAGLLLDGAPFRADDSAVLRVREIAEGDAAVTFKTAAGHTVTLTPVQAASLKTSLAVYRVQILSQSAALQDAPPADPTSDRHWPAVPSLTLGSQ